MSEFQNPSPKQGQVIPRLKLSQAKQTPMFDHLPQFASELSYTASIGYQQPPHKCTIPSGTLAVPETRLLASEVLRLGQQTFSDGSAGASGRVQAFLVAWQATLHRLSQRKNIDDWGSVVKSELKLMKQYLRSITAPLPVPTQNFIQALHALSDLVARHIREEGITSEQACAELYELTANFAAERILAASDIISEAIAARVRPGQRIVTVGASHLIVRALVLSAERLQKDGQAPFEVSVIDSFPSSAALRVATALSAAKINTSYGLLGGAAQAIRGASMVLSGAYSMMGDGSMLARAGTALVASLAHRNGVPFIVLCESYKFSPRVKVNSLSYNVLMDPVALLRNPTNSKDGEDPMDGWESHPSLRLCYPTYDITPPSMLSTVCSEFGEIPPSSVSVMVQSRDMMAYLAEAKE
eukprot:gnl/Dysnectes_brevis/2415_a2865_1484.p1 GENE.gnl/Dysnectes_brevis/2415_a2865_1484~~gnl/Dysnectes_brevis/2415_a2865_1484.p1  ORF type:complete len:413 (+),score=58.49 gnl/Dysnectes_brevis/2415_a2865_1484:449-1687(+)